MFISVTEVILTELASGVSERFEQFGNGGIFGTHAICSAWQSNLAQPRAEYALAHDEGCAASGARLLGVVVGENHAFVGNAVDVGRLVAHYPFRVATEVRLTNVITPNNENVGFLLSLFCH